MQLVFYKTKSESNAVTKTLTDALTITGHVTDNVSVMKPVFIVGYDARLLKGHNYCYVADFGRYYWVTPPTVEKQTMVVSMQEDVLMSWSEDIKNADAHVIRSSSNYDKFIADSMIINKANTRTYQRKLGAGFTKNDKYLVLIGG